MAPQGRMRGEFAAASRLWGIMANLPLISQRAGPLTAPPRGEAFLLCEKSVLHGVEDGGTACGEVHAALQIAGVGRAPSQLISIVLPSVKLPDAMTTLSV